MAINYQAGGSFLPAQAANFNNPNDATNFAIAPTIGLTDQNGTTTVSATLLTTAGGQTMAASTFVNPTVTGDASSGIVVAKTIAFVENATMTTLTGTVVIPAGATLLDIRATSSVLWSKASARLTIGDTQSANGWLLSTNLNATDLLVGEMFSAAGGTSYWAGLPGAYLNATTGVFGQATATKAGPYYVTAGNVIAVVTVTPGAGAAGRTFVTVTYAVGQAVAPVQA
jgi:hypothetical protein